MSSRNLPSAFYFGMRADGNELDIREKFATGGVTIQGHTGANQPLIAIAHLNLPNIEGVDLARQSAYGVALAASLSGLANGILNNPQRPSDYESLRSWRPERADIAYAINADVGGRNVFGQKIVTGDRLTTMLGVARKNDQGELELSASIRSLEEAPESVLEKLLLSFPDQKKLMRTDDEVGLNALALTTAFLLSLTSGFVRSRSRIGTVFNPALALLQGHLEKTHWIQPGLYDAAVS